MIDTDLFFSTRPAYPWSEYPLGLPALGLVSALLVVLTLWTYLGQPQANRRRVFIVLALRLLALLVALLTAVRPSVGIQEDPKYPSVLLLGVDLSESMTIRDEVNSQARIDAVKKTLARCESTLEELRTEQNVNVVLYGFGPADFAEASSKYDLNAPAAARQSDYGTYLNRTLERWQGERFLRGHLIIGDGADNGVAFSAVAEAGRWRAANGLIHTFAVGRSDTPTDAKDVAIVAVSADPSPVPIKNDLVIKAIINAFGFQNATVPVKVQFDLGDGKGYQDVATERVTLKQERNNEVTIPLKAPDKPGEVKVRVEIPIASVPGDKAEQNNTVETYLTVTREGVRVLIVNRLSYEHAAIRRALAADKRIDLNQVLLQPDQTLTPEDREAFDFDNRAYDVIIIGNISGRQLTAIDPALPEKIREQVTKKGVGLLFTGGHATFLGTPNVPGATGWQGFTPIMDILPVDLEKRGPYPDAPFESTSARLQYLPTIQGADHFLNRLADMDSVGLWNRLNELTSRSRFTGLSRMGTPKGNATIFAVASDAGGSVPIPVPPADAASLPPVLVGHQMGDANRGRVLALAAQDTFLWQRLGQPKANDGRMLFGRFWRQMVLWLAHQDEDDGAAFARPEFRRLPVRGKQSVKVGLRGPGGADVIEPKFEVKVIAPGENEQTARVRTVVPDPSGGYRLSFEPPLPGEYSVKVVANGKAANGNEVKGEATARFIAYPEASDEMLRTAADPDFLKSVAAAGGGKFYRLDDLPGFLKELKSSPIEAAKPKPRFLPDWRRNHSGGFLTVWLVMFAALVGSEWALRRLWGMV